jgi:malate synthase
MLRAMSAQPDEVLYSREQGGPRVEILGPHVERSDEVLTPLALQLLASLHRRFNGRRLELLTAREQRQVELDSGVLPDFLPETAAVRAGDWSIASIPADLADRRFQVIGPVDRKTVITALNAPLRAFTADFEDSCSPTWSNMIRGQVNLADAIRRTITFSDDRTGKIYRLSERTATVVMRPRGWHLPEKHVRINGEMVSGALFDFAVFIANNHTVLAQRGTGPYFYLPKLESHLEARLWNDVFLTTQEVLGLPRGTIKATVLIETIPAVFAMDEILHELREHAVGLNYGRWDYVFSFAKTFRQHPDFLLPDRSALGMERHFLKSSVDLLIQTCQRRGAHAMGAAATAQASNREVFPGDLIRVPEGEITDSGLRSSIRVAVQYIEAWLRGVGCLSLYNFVEDAATAEICRAQVWQWLRHGARTSDGRVVSEDRFDRLLTDELDRIHDEVGPARLATGVFPTAARLFERMSKQDSFDEFLTVPAYEILS